MTRWPRLRSYAAVVLSAGLTAASLPFLAGSALAAPSEGYAEWTFGGTNRDFRGTVTLPPGFPAASFETDSRTPPSPPLPSGANAYLPAGSAFGAAFGSSENKRYLSLRPNADNATSPSTTTYTFEQPTPTAGWGFAFGDIDAEILEVSALDADGNPVPAEGLSVEGAFNYCDASPRSPSCTGQVAPYAVPQVTTNATSVSIENPLCPGDPGQCDTQGAAVWFRPSLPLTSLTVTSAWKAGLPVYQTWFAGVSNAVSGTVTGDCRSGIADVPVELVDGARDEPVDRTRTAGDGSYRFDRVLGRAGYRVRLDPPPDVQVEPPRTQPVDASSGDVTGVDFTTSAAARIVGRVEADGAPLPGVRVVLVDGDTRVAESRTDDAGRYEFDRVGNGTYRVEVLPPPNYEPVGASERRVVVDCADQQLDGFVLQQVFDVTGEVVDEDGEPVPGAEIELTEPDGTPVAETVTDENGEFVLEDVPGGDYVVEVDPPAGLDPTSIDIQVPVGPGGIPPIVVPPAGEQALPDVGGVSLGLLVLGLGSVLSGCGLSVWSWRRR